jgi:hypothetical protein
MTPSSRSQQITALILAEAPGLKSQQAPHMLHPITIPSLTPTPPTPHPPHQLIYMESKPPPLDSVSETKGPYQPLVPPIIHSLHSE